MTPTRRARRQERLRRRLAVGVAPRAVLLGAAAVLWRTAGGPDFATVGAVIRGAQLDRPAGLAVSIAIVWALLLAVAAYSVGVGAVDLVRAVWRSRWRARWDLMLAAGGTVFLAVALIRHLTPSVDLCCGSVQEARAQIGR